VFGESTSSCEIIEKTFKTKDMESELSCLPPENIMDTKTQQQIKNGWMIHI